MALVAPPGRPPAVCGRDAIVVRVRRVPEETTHDVAVCRAHRLLLDRHGLLVVAAAVQAGLAGTWQVQAWEAGAS